MTNRVINQPYVRRKSKLTKVPVPELFFEHHLQLIPKGQSALVDRLRKIEPTRRGKGYSRVLMNLTETEWESMYTLAIWGRSRVRGSERGPELFGAVCARAMVKRMEDSGVSIPIPYEKGVAYRTKKRGNKLKNDDIPGVARTPITIDTADEEPTLKPVEDLNGVSDEELTQFLEDMGLGSKVI